MSQAPIKTPVRRRITPLDELKERNPAAYQAYLNSPGDTRQGDFRDSSQRRKKPFLPDIFRRHP